MFQVHCNIKACEEKIEFQLHGTTSYTFLEQLLHIEQSIPLIQLIEPS